MVSTFRLEKVEQISRKDENPKKALKDVASF